MSTLEMLIAHYMGRPCGGSLIWIRPLENGVCNPCLQDAADQPSRPIFVTGYITRPYRALGPNGARRAGV